jgi:hypothetical protein
MASAKQHAEMERKRIEKSKRIENYQQFIKRQLIANGWGWYTIPELHDYIEAQYPDQWLPSRPSAHKYLQPLVDERILRKSNQHWKKFKHRGTEMAKACVAYCYNRVDNLKQVDD